MIIDFDKYSLILDNKRLQIRSAAMHYFRNPGTNVWKDRLSKIKACGYNTVDLYFCWQYHSDEPGIYDFTDTKDIRALLDIASELELYVIARPGPYINAELSAGGLPFWLFNVPDAIIRNRTDGNYIYSKPYMEAVKEWYSRIIPIINEYQNIIAFQIENEYSTNEAEPDYIQELYDMARELGVKVPIFHNDAFCACLYSDIINIYAFDVYPTINISQDWHKDTYIFDTLDHIEENLKDCKADAPLYIAELQAGWFDRWRGKGYKYIRELLGKDHINIVTKNSAFSGYHDVQPLYGMRWNFMGKLASDDVYTSYDFAAPISECGIPEENYYKAKEINCFLQAFDLSSTDLIADENTLLEDKAENIYLRLRSDNLNNCNWLFARNLNSLTTELKIPTLYSLALKPYDMKILPVNLKLFGCRLDFSSFSIFGRLEKENYETIFFILDEDSELILSEFENKELSGEGEIEEFEDKIRIKFNKLPENDMFSFKFSRLDKTTEFIFLKENTADKTWLLDGKAIIGPDILLDNPYKAGFREDISLQVSDLNNKSTWHNTKIKAIGDFETSRLCEWKSFKCAPEIDPDYDYSNWKFAENNDKPDCISNRIYDSFIWYKSSFKGFIRQIEISAKHCYSVYLNGSQIYNHNSLYFEGCSEISESITIDIDNDFLNKDKNEITVLVQNLGFDKGFCNEPNLPRGLLGFKTNPQKTIEWQIRGALTPEREEWGFLPVDDLNDASSNSYLSWHCASFEINRAENIFAPLFLNFNNPPFDKANIYLNGYLIGHYWKSMGPQINFT